MPTPASPSGASVVWVVRHGETAWNAEGRMQGQVDVPLNEAGRRQARQLGERLGRARPGAVVSSDLARAYETAALAAEPAGLVPRRDPGLRELHLGAWEGLSFADVTARWPQDARRFREREPGFRVPGGETREEAVERLLAALGRHAPPEGSPPTVLVSHGGVIGMLLQVAQGRSVREPLGVPIPNGALAVLVRAGPVWRLERLNDTAHLTPRDAAPFAFS